MTPHRKILSYSVGKPPKHVKLENEDQICKIKIRISIQWGGWGMGRTEGITFGAHFIK